MEREVLILPNGESGFAWDLQFAERQQYRESCPCTVHASDGSVRSGTLHYTVESAEVSFCASPGLLRVGHRGQLSSAGARFYEVTIASLQPADAHVLVTSHAMTKFAFEKDP